MYPDIVENGRFLPLFFFFVIRFHTWRIPIVSARPQENAKTMKVRQYPLRSTRNDSI